MNYRVVIIHLGLGNSMLNHLKTLCYARFMRTLKMFPEKLNLFFFLFFSFGVEHLAVNKILKKKGE